MNKYQIIQRYKQQENNLNNNIKFELDKPKHHETTDIRLVEYMRGQLSIIREIQYYLLGQQDIFHNKPIDYILGDIEQ